MICEPCRLAAAALASYKHLVSVGGLIDPMTVEEFAQTKVAAHDQCKGETWCDCQHRARIQWELQIQTALLKLGNHEVVLGGTMYDNGNGTAVESSEAEHRAPEMFRRPHAADYTPLHQGGDNSEAGKHEEQRDDESAGEHPVG
jgi:hypothetical protein